MEKKKRDIKPEILTTVKGDFIWAIQHKKAIFEPNENGKFNLVIFK
jgi:hypothetical protein